MTYSNILSIKNFFLLHFLNDKLKLIFGKEFLNIYSVSIGNIYDFNSSYRMIFVRGVSFLSYYKDTLPYCDISLNNLRIVRKNSTLSCYKIHC